MVRNLPPKLLEPIEISRTDSGNLKWEEITDRPEESRFTMEKIEKKEEK